MATRRSSAGISHRSLLPHIPSIPPCSQQHPRSGIAPESLNSSSPPLRHLGSVRLRQGLSDSHHGQAAPDQLLPSQPGLSSDTDTCPSVGVRPLPQLPRPPRAGPVLPALPFPHTSFILPSFAWVCTVFPAGQGLLSALSWRSACASVSEGVFLMHPWRERYSMYTCSSTILFFCHQLVQDDGDKRER